MWNLKISAISLLAFTSLLIVITFIQFSFVSGDSTLKQLHVLFRHGERSPTETYPNDPYKNFNWSGGWGHLTNRGKLQMYQLGKIIRSQYNDFLPELYWPEDINVTSSYADRCLSSAQLLTAGLFPPKGPQVWNTQLLWQPVPVHYLPRPQDNMIAMKSKCDKYDRMFKETMISPKVQNITLSNQHLMQYLSEHTGMNVDNIGTVETLYNTLEIEKLNNLMQPLWINETLMDTMKQLGAQNLALYSETEFMKRMKGGVLLQYIIRSMERSLEGKKEPILHLYSGHDLTVVHILRALNLVDTIKPGFGASLVFELYTEGEVKIIYRSFWEGNPEQKEIQSCGSPCQLSIWKRILEPVLPIDWVKECKLDANIL